MPTEKKFTGFFDGACEPINPGGAMGCGAIIFNDGNLVWKTSWMEPAGPITSNNVAEYLAFHAALDWFFENDLLKERIVVHGDSRLVINQMFGNWKMRGGLYVDLAVEAKKKVACFSSLTGLWVPREQNQLADDLSKFSLTTAGVQITDRSHA